MGAYGFFGQPVEEREAALDWLHDEWDNACDHVRAWRRFVRNRTRI